MSAYDDELTSCPMCSLGLDPANLCDCDEDPQCIRCHRVNHVEHRLDRQIREGLAGWGSGGAA